MFVPLQPGAKAGGREVVKIGKVDLVEPLRGSA